MSDVSVFVLEAIKKSCSIDLSAVTADTNLIDDLGIDSIDFLDVIYEIDRKFGIKLPVESWIGEIQKGNAKTAHYFVLKQFAARIEAEIAKVSASKAAASAAAPTA